MQLASTLRQIFLFLTPENFRTRRKFIITTICILVVWLTVIIYIETQHEFFRDEVRALSQVRQANSILDLYDIIQYDGHPILWFVFLFIGKTISNSPLVLPIVAITISFIAVSLFMFYAPFPFWFKILFICSLPLYEYTIMARDYGLSMLFIFLSAMLYRNRNNHPYLFALSLALLANTTVHAAILAVFFLAIWIWDILFIQKKLSLKNRLRSILLPVCIILIGFFVCLFFTFPRENSIITTIERSFSARELSLAAYKAFLRPDITFKLLLPTSYPVWLSFGILFLAFLGLLNKPHLLFAAVGGQVAFGILFQLVNHGSYRHQGLFIVFLIALYWLYNDETNNIQLNRTKVVLNKIGLYLAVGLLIANGVVYSVDRINEDFNYKKSSSKAFGSFLNESKAYNNAIIVPEPDFLIESLPYYANNKIFLPREDRFGTTVSWTTASDARLSLRKLLALARNIKMQTNQPVLIVFGHPNIDKTKDESRKYSYNKVFSWTPEDIADFDKATSLIANYDQATSGENYQIYELK